MPASPRVFVPLFCLAACATTQPQVAASASDDGLLRDYNAPAVAEAPVTGASAPVSTEELLEPVDVGGVEPVVAARADEPLEVESLEQASLEESEPAPQTTAPDERGYSLMYEKDAAPAGVGTISVRAQASKKCKGEVAGKRFSVAKSVTVPAGRHTLTLTCKGNKRVTRQIEVDAGAHVALVLSGKSLKPAGKSAKLAARGKKGRRRAG
jgi:hypothetical protein